MSAEWWTLDEKNAYTAVFAKIDFLSRKQSGQQLNNIKHLKMYSNRDLDGNSVAAWVVNNYFRPDTRANPTRLSYNVTSSCIDTLVSKIGKNKIKPMFLTQKGSYKLQKKARQLNRFVSGMFYQCKVHKIAPMCLRDAGIFGSGFAQVFTDENNEPRVEKVMPDEIQVDCADAYYGTPKTLYRSRFVSLAWLKTKYAKEPEILHALGSEKLRMHIPGGEFSDSVHVVEAWHLPSHADAKDGKHIICTASCTLLLEEWEDECFPFAVLHYSEPVIGSYFGTGLAEQLKGIQIEINRILMHMHDSMKMLTHPKVFLPNGSKINPNYIASTKIGTMIPVSGEAPVWYTPNVISGDEYKRLEDLYVKGYEIAGISQLSAQSKNPANLESGRALQVYADIETDRFATTALAFQQFHLDIAQLLIKEAKRIANRVGNFEVRAFDRREGLETIRWKEINLKESEYVMQCWPTNMLADSPAGKLDEIQRISTSIPGIMEPDVVLELLDFPDLDAHTSMLTAPYRLARKFVEKIVDEEQYVEPDPRMNLQAAFKYAIYHYNEELCRDEINDNVLAMLDLFIQRCESLLKAAAPPTPVDPAAQQQAEQPAPV